MKLDSKENLKDKKLAYPDTCYWFMDRAAVKAQFAYSEFVTPEVVDEGLENAVHIAETCKAELSSKMHMPAFPVPAGKTEDAILYGTCMEKLNQIIEDKPNPQAYVDRLMHELEVIKQKGFCGYFLIVQDYIRWARAWRSRRPWARKRCGKPCGESLRHFAGRPVEVRPDVRALP